MEDPEKLKSRLANVRAAVKQLLRVTHGHESQEWTEKYEAILAALRNGRVPIGEILSDETGIRLFALGRVVRAKVEIASVDANTGLPRSWVGQIRGDFVLWTCHRATPFQRFRGRFTTKS